ncbi:MAG: hypothetical protein ACYC2O_00440 [Microthrixaceae bacterium]
MTSRRDRDDPTEDRPNLQLVRSGDEPDRPGATRDRAAATPPAATDTTDTDAEAGTELSSPGDEPALSADASPAVEARAILSDADPVAYYKMLNGLVRSSHSSVLQTLPYSADLDYHDPACVVVDPEPTNIETIELYARAAYPDFDKVLLSAFMDPAQDHLLAALYHLLVTEGENVALVTNHGQIIDIALVIAGLQGAMLAPDRSFGVLGEHTSLEVLAERFNVLVSRMITTRQAFNVPAIQVLQSATRTFLSVPQTASRRRAKLETALVRANNVLMRAELDERLARGGQLLAMAASGSQDLTIPALMQKARAAWRQRRGDDPGEAPTLHLQPLYDGTISLMQSCRYVLPIAICLDAVTPCCEIGGLTRLTEKDDCHRIMDWIALAHQEATGIPTIYHWHEDDLLTQVRALLNR